MSSVSTSNTCGSTWMSPSGPVKRRALESWRANPDIEVLGNADIPRLAIISFIIRHQGRALHHEFVVALLNDLFGIQSRGGCSCAGPYGHRLLHIDARRSRAFEKVIVEGAEGLKPGREPAVEAEHGQAEPDEPERALLTPDRAQ